MGLTDWVDAFSDDDRLTGFYYGVVVVNEDPELSARVKVFIPGVVEPYTDWAEPAGAPASGSSTGLPRGTYTAPPLGSKVIVGFIEGNPNLPFYLTGGFPHNQANGQPNSPAKGITFDPDGTAVPIDDRSVTGTGSDGAEVYRLAFGRWELVIDTRGDNTNNIASTAGYLRIRDHLLAAFPSEETPDFTDTGVVYGPENEDGNLEIVLDRLNASITIKAPYEINLESAGAINLTAPIVSVNGRRFKTTTKPI